MAADNLTEPPYSDTSWLTGQLLIAMPGMPDPRFSHAVIYICSHGPNGAMGLVINRLYTEASFPMLLNQLNIKASSETRDLPVHFGGPVETGRGFVLHSKDYVREGTTGIDQSVALSATVEVLQAMAEGGGPDQAVIALGYTGWGAGQLEAEMKANGWLTAEPDEEILFGAQVETKWERALAKIGVSPVLLSFEVGNA